jgi:hypothetical protein
MIVGNYMLFAFEQQQTCHDGGSVETQSRRITRVAGVKEEFYGGPHSMNVNRDSPDDSRTGLDIRNVPVLLQDRSGARTASVTSGSPNTGRGLIWPFSLAFGRTPPVGSC